MASATQKQLFLTLSVTPAQGRVQLPSSSGSLQRNPPASLFLSLSTP